jgi:hypothetical protein
MDAFWKWLMRSNARWVFYCALVALLLVIGYWAWREYTPLEQTAPLPTSALKDSPTPVLDIGDVLDRSLASAPAQGPVNVFRAPEPPSPPPPSVPPPAPNKPPPAAPPVQPTVPTVANPPEVQPPSAPPVKVRDTVSLTYRGLLKRTDGKVLALIEDSKSKGGVFYSVSNQLFGVRVGGIDTHQATVTLSDGSVLPLKLGEPVVFEGGKRAN